MVIACNCGFPIVQNQVGNQSFMILALTLAPIGQEFRPYWPTLQERFGRCPVAGLRAAAMPRHEDVLPPLRAGC